MSESEKILALARELAATGQITEQQVMDTYYELFIRPTSPLFN